MSIRPHITITLLMSLALISCKEETKSELSHEIKIGEQIWMQTDLDVVTFSNGDTIPEAKSEAEWIKAGENRQPAWCYHPNLTNAPGKKLYNWFAVSDSRGLAPDGWHVPTLEEWTQLTNHLGADAGNRLKSAQDWIIKADNRNSSGFEAKPGSYRLSTGSFGETGKYGDWWTSKERDSASSFFVAITYNKSNVISAADKKSNGFSVRCLKNPKK